MKYRNKVLAVLLVTVLTAVPLAACSKKAAPASVGDTNSGGQGNGSSQTRIVGKVTSVIGNQVVLAVGTLKNAGGFGERSESSGSSGGSSGGAGRAGKSEASSQNETASSGAQVSGSSGSSSGSITLTGETQTLLIPVGLTLSSGHSNRKSGGSQPGASAGGAAGGSFGGTGGTSGGTSGGFGGGSAGGSFGGFGGGSGSTSRSGGTGNSGSRNGGSAGGTSAGTAGSTLATLQRSQDFSSIKKGMVLQIVEETLSDGTQGITQVRIISQ